MDNSTKLHVANLKALTSLAAEHRRTGSAVPQSSNEAIAIGLFLLTEVIGTAVIAAMEEDQYDAPENPNDND